MAAVPFNVKLHGASTVSPLAGLSNCSARSRTEVTFQISWQLHGASTVSPLAGLSNCSARSRTEVTFQISWPTKSCKIRLAKLTCERFVAFGKGLEDDGGDSKEKHHSNAISPKVNGLEMTGPLSTADFHMGEENGLVSIGSHRIFLRSAGPDRKPGEPVVILLQGLASSSKGFAAVFRLLKPFVRVYLYDRSGFGQSELSPDEPTSTTIVSELNLLLQNAGVGPPYILVGHSWGGLLSREFFALRPDDVFGMVLIDANQERTLEILDWREPRVWAIAGKVDWYESTGLNKEHKLTEEEWRAYVDDQASRKHLKQSLKERALYAKSFPILAEKAQLHRTPEPLMGDRPLSVVMGRQHRDYQRMYDAAMKQGHHGTEEEQAYYLEFLPKNAEIHPKLQKELLSLSKNSRFVDATESGHDVHLMQPELIVDEVKWVLEEYRNFAVQSGHTKKLAQLI